MVACKSDAVSVRVEPPSRPRCKQPPNARCAAWRTSWSFMFIAYCRSHGYPLIGVYAGALPDAAAGSRSIPDTKSKRSRA